MASILFQVTLLHLLLTLFATATATTTATNSVSESATMYTLLKTVTPSLHGWSPTTTHCSWQGIKCDEQNRVISINLASNSLSGTLPESLNSLSRLTTLLLHHNNFSGVFPSLANLSRLRILTLHNNSFTSVPDRAFSGLISLSVITLSNNVKLSPWSFPSDLAGSRKLTEIDASNANLIGSIPDIFQSFPRLVNLTLSYNNLTGSLPKSLIGSRIRSLKVDNQMFGLTGDIDSLTGMNNLSIVWLQGNRFTGVIPSSFVSLPNLLDVRIENNQFELPIPKFPKNVRLSSGAIGDNDNDDWLFNCRRCKVYIRVVSGGGGVPVAPQETPSEEKKTNVGAVVVFSILLVAIIVAFAVCICMNRKRTRGKAYSQQMNVQMAIPREETLPKQPVLEKVTKNEGQNGKEEKLPGSKIVGPKGKEQGQGQGNKEKLGGQGKKEKLAKGKEQANKDSGGEERLPEGKEQGNRDNKDDKKQMHQKGGNKGKLPEGKEEKKREHRDDKKEVHLEGDRKRKLPKEKECREDKKQVHQDEVKRQPEKGEEAVGKDENQRFQKRRDVEQPKAEEILESPCKTGNAQVVEEEEAYTSLNLPKKYPYHYIKIITDNFNHSNVIGEGGFGHVFKATLLNGPVVAIKRLKMLQGRTIDDFKNEVAALGRTSHFNLVKLIGYCAEDKYRVLVYEYIRNGSLSDWIFGTDKLTWTETKKVILGIAKGLVYLHENCEKTIIHRDLKPQNVLLDEKKNAKLCDFGISKLIERDQSSTSTVGMGTPGYVAPEVEKYENITVKVDVYSFGILVLETMFRKRYRDLVSPKCTHLQLSQLPGLIKNLGDEVRKNGNEIETMAKLAISCLTENPEDRPTMSEVLGVVKGVDIKVRRK